MADNSDVVWRARFKGKEYTVRTRDLTLGRLRECKHMFGREYANFSGFVLLVGQGDVDALACVVWIAQQVAKDKNVKSPLEMDFSLDDFEPVEDVSPDGDGEDGGNGDRPTEPQPTRTRSSSKTSKT